MDLKTLQMLDQKYIMRTYNRYPIALTSGKGVKVWDIDGKEYLDFLSGIAVNSLGHCHPAVIEAIVKQINTLMHVSNLYYTEPAVELAKLLVENGGLDKIFFCNSGAEANEGAIKLARKYQSRQGLSNKFQIISFNHSFHGRTLATLAATAKPEIKQGFGPLPEGFVIAEFNDIAALNNIMNENVAGVIVEPIQGEGGVYPAKIEFLQALREHCNRIDAVLIFDEIQCGLGRIGSLFAYQKFNVKPDVVTLAKGIANGLPFGAICATDKIAAGFQAGDHATTFGGNPVAAAAAIATIRTLLEKKYIQNAEMLGNYLIAKLNQLKAKYPAAIAEVRGQGLMIGIELKIDAKQVLQGCHEKGLLANVTANNTLRLLPPFIITQEDINKALCMIESVIAQLSVVQSAAAIA